MLPHLEVGRGADAPHSPSVAQVFEAVRPHVIAEAEIMGLFER